MNGISPDWLSTLIWAAAGLIALSMFRAALIGLAGRAKKISYKDWSIDLTRFKEFDMTWTKGGYDVRKMTAQEAQDSGRQSVEQFTQQMSESSDVDYVTIDLGKGDEWWASRLYLFSRLLSEVSTVQALVLLESMSGPRRRFLTVIPPVDVWKALERECPWFYSAYSIGTVRSSLNAQNVPNQGTVGVVFGDSLVGNAEAMSRLVGGFLQSVQQTNTPPVTEDDKFQKLRSTQLAVENWERTPLVNLLLIDRLGLNTNSIVEIDYATGEKEIGRRVLQSEGPCVAVIGKDGRFRYLVNREQMLEQAWRHYSEASND